MVTRSVLKVVIMGVAIAALSVPLIGAKFRASARSVAPAAPVAARGANPVTSKRRVPANLSGQRKSGKVTPQSVMKDGPLITDSDSGTAGGQLDPRAKAMLGFSEKPKPRSKGHWPGATASSGFAPQIGQPQNINVRRALSEGINQHLRH